MFTNVRGARMRWTMFAVLVAALALVGAGCGGGDDEGAGDTDTAVVTDTATTDTTTDETTTEDTETDTDTDVDAGGFASEDCADLISASAALSQAFGAAGTSDLGDSANAFDQLADRVPDDIKADFQVLADAYREYADAIQDIGLQEGDTPSAEQIAQLTQALSSIDTQAVSEASTNISTWATANCPSG
jgi:hypothetical protein